MVRTTEPDVRAIVDTNTSISVAPFIEQASILVDRVVTCATNKGVTLTTNEKRVIENLLAAHFYSHRDQLYQEKKTGKASAVFQGKTGMNLDSTQYGQDAMLMDPSGCLTSMNRGRNLGITWLGKPKSDQIDISDRD